MRRVVISTAIIVFFITLGTIIAILYAQGYRLTPKSGKILQGTGLLVLSSTPEGARVFINDHLTTATDNTINLTPGEYQVKIEKEGYFPWSKKVVIKEKEVSQATATLFPSTPKLEPLTITGIEKTIVDETGTLIAYTVASSSARKNGVYLLNMSSRPILPIGGLATQLSDDTQANFSLADLSFSPDGDQLLASISAGLSGTTTYMLSTKSFNNAPQDITNTLYATEQEWQQLKDLKHQHTLNALPRKLRPLANQYFDTILLSPEEDKILYTASSSGQLVQIITPALKGVNSTPENRRLEQHNIYVYDIKEDRNYLIYDAKAQQDQPTPHFIWHPDSDHLVYSVNGRINVMEFDGQNNTTIYAGPFQNNFVSVWPDGSHILIVTNLNIPGASSNLYRISLR